jgi:hypothetical protein
MGVLVCCLGAETAVAEGPRSVIGLSLPTFGFIHYNDEGQLVSVTGFNVGLGYSARYFFAKDGLQPNRFNGYWGWGTMVLILPYVEIGTAYPIAIAEGTQYVVFDLGLLYIVPYIGISVYY